MPLARHDPFLIPFCYNVAISTHMPLARHDREQPTTAYQCCDFYSHASCEAWHSRIIWSDWTNQFLLTCLLRGMTEGRQIISTSFPDFYSHASCEAWRSKMLICTFSATFLLTCLLRGMTCKNKAPSSTKKFLLTCLLRGMTSLPLMKLSAWHISTHMPLARHDLCTIWTTLASVISTHMPLARHDGNRNLFAKTINWFLLTCLLRGMTGKI